MHRAIKSSLICSSVLRLCALFSVSCGVANDISYSASLRIRHVFSRSFLRERERVERVSVERVVSGLGLPRIYEFLAKQSPQLVSATVEAEMRTSDIASVVTKFGLAKKDVLCEQALDLFVNNYGSEAGNLALKTLCYGGLYIAGGIAPKILPAMMDNTLFYANLVAKGRMKSLLSSIPIYIVVHPQVGLLGAQVMALRLLEQEGQKVNELPSCDKEADSAASFGPSSPIIRGVSANAVAAMSEPLLGAAAAAPVVGAIIG